MSLQNIKVKGKEYKVVITLNNDRNSCFAVDFT